jgi:Urea transporter.
LIPLYDDALHFALFFTQLAEGYAWVLLMPSMRAGVGVMLATFISPKLGIAGLIGAATALLVARWMRVADSLASLYVFNGLLTGMFLAAHYQPNGLFLSW